MVELLRRCRPLLGTFVEISAARADAVDAAFQAIERVHRLMSAHEPGSGLSQINRFAHLRPIHVDPWIAAVIERALFWSERSQRAFDVVRAGRRAVATGTLPRHPGQPEPVAGDSRCVEMRGGFVSLSKPACLDLGGIAKGFAVDCAVEALREGGCRRGIVNAGGDLRCFGAAPWPISVLHPQSRRAAANVAVENGALATSAGLPADGGLSFDHLGGASGSLVSVTVLAPRACDSDALTKIVWAGGAAASALLAEVDATALLISADAKVERIGAKALEAA